MKFAGSQNAAWIAVSAGLALGAGRAGAQTAMWTNGAGNGLWHTAGNWSTSAVPGIGTPVVIPQGFPGVTAQGGIGAATISAMSPVSIGGGASVIAQGGSFAGGLTVINNSISAGGPVTIGATSSMGGATFTGGVQWTNTGLMTVNPGLGINSGTTFNNTGTANVEGALLLSGAGSSMTNPGLLRLVGTGRMASGGLLVNTGEMRKTGAALSTFEPRLNNNGALLVDAGTLSISGACNFLGGGVSVAPGGLLRLETPSGAPHVFSGMASVSGGGDFAIQTLASNPPPVLVAAPVSFSMSGSFGLHLVTGNLQLDAVLRNQGLLTWQSHTILGSSELHNEADLVIPAGGSAEIGAGTTLVNKSIVDMRGHMDVAGGGTFKNENGATVLWDGGNFLTSTGRIDNQGTIRRGGGSGSIGVPLDQSAGGRTEAIEATVTLSNGGRWGAGGGFFNVSNGEIVLSGIPPFIVAAGNHVIEGGPRVRQTANSTVQVHSGAALTLNVAGALGPEPVGYMLQGGLLGGPGLVLNTGLFECNGTIGVSGQADFRNSGTVGITGGGLTGTFTNNPQRFVLHFGNWSFGGGTAVNHGVWACVPGFGTALMTGQGLFRNANVLGYTPEANFGSTIQVAFDNQGLVNVTRGTLQFTGPVAQLQNGSLTGGVWEVAPGATLILPPPLTRITTGARVIGSRTGQTGVQGLGSVSEISSGGELEANGDITFNGQVNVINGGRLLVCAPSTVHVPQRLYNGWAMFEPTRVDQSTRGDGPEPRIIAQALENAATVGPGGPGEPGPFNLTGIYAQTMEGELEIEIGGLAPIGAHDRMDVTGSATLAGTLRLDLLAGFVPTPGQSFTILTATGGISGRFTTVEQPAAMPPGLEFTPVYGSGSVAVVVGEGCYPDCNTDGAVTVADFGCFQSLFVGGHTYADCNSDGALSVADFGCFQTAFVAGCP